MFLPIKGNIRGCQEGQAIAAERYKNKDNNPPLTNATKGYSRIVEARYRLRKGNAVVLGSALASTREKGQPCSRLRFKPLTSRNLVAANHAPTSSGVPTMRGTKFAPQSGIRSRLSLKIAVSRSVSPTCVFGCCTKKILQSPTVGSHT